MTHGLNLNVFIHYLISVTILVNLRETWTQVIDLRPQICQIDTNPQFTQIVPLTEMGVLVTLETKIGEVKGMINIFYPYLTLEPIMPKISTQYWFGTVNRGIHNPAYENYANNNIPVQLSAELFTRAYSIKEISDWKAGTILLPSNPPMHDQCRLRLGCRNIWHCEILPDQKRFKKQIKIIGYAERPSLTEGIQMGKNQSKENVLDALLASYVKVTVELGSTSRTMKQILTYVEGSILELDKLAGEPLDIIANGVQIGKGETVVIDENFGVRITEVYGLPSDNSKVESSDSSTESPSDI